MVLAPEESTNILEAQTEEKKTESEVTDGEKERKRIATTETEGELSRTTESEEKLMITTETDEQRTEATEKTEEKLMETTHNEGKRIETLVNEGKRIITTETQENHPSTCPAMIFSNISPPVDLDGFSPRLVNILKGASVPGDNGAPPDPPPWLDMELFKEGRKFYQNYLFCLAFSELMSLLLVLAESNVLKPLIHTHRSDTYSRARRRYLSTLLHIIAWFEGDVWDSSSQAHRDIIGVRTTHFRLARAFNSPREHERVRTVTVRDSRTDESMKSVLLALKEDLATSGFTPLPETEKQEDVVFLSQLDMAFTQYSFMGIILTHPRELGAGAASDREMAGLVHFWRGLGWLLGISDNYNFCSGSVQETRDLCREVETKILIPRLQNSNMDYLNMVDYLITGISSFLPMLSLPAMLKYLAYTLHIPVPSLSKQLTWFNMLQYWLMRFTFGAVLLFPNFLVHLNAWFRAVIKRVKGRDRPSLEAYRKSQQALAMPLMHSEGGKCPVG